MNVTCVHHFIVDTPNGPTVQGVCRNCGEVRIYLSGEPDPDRKFNKQLTVPLEAKRQLVTPTPKFVTRERRRLRAKR